MEEQWPPQVIREEVAGVKVVKDEVLPSGLTKSLGRLVPIKGVRRLTLETDEVVLGCANCVFVCEPGDLRQLGKVRQHRRAEHGASLGGNSRKPGQPGQPGQPEPMLPVSVPGNALSMTLHELFELAAHVDDWENVLTNMTAQLEEALTERDEARAGQRAAEKELASMKRKAARALGLELVEG